MNRSTSALLLTILLIGMGQELWSPFLPAFIKRSIELEDGLRGGLARLGLPLDAAIILAVGLFGTWRDFQEGIYSYLGGRIGGTLGTRRALIIFTALPLVGYGMLLMWLSPITAFAALPFITAYDSIAQPATLTVIGSTLGERHRTMAISMQSIQRRIPRIIAYLSGGALMAALGAIGGTRAAIAISAALVLVAIVVQIRFLQAQTRDTATRKAGFSLQLLRHFDPQLKRLLAADIFARLAEGLPRELYILYAVISVGALGAGDGFGVFGISMFTFGQLLALQALVSLLLYIPIGALAARSGASKKPFITLTFIFFSLFPLAFWLLGHWFGVVGLVAAYVIAGLREIGEPARKAMITELVPQEARTAATGLYWAVRTFAVMLAPIAGTAAWLWIGPEAVFIAASGIGFVGAVFFSLIFRDRHLAMRI